MSGDTATHKDNVARVKDAIARYIVAVPASGSVNQMTVVATTPSGNGKPIRSVKVAGNRRVIHRRTSSPWQAFVKQYVAKQRSAGSMVAFPQLVKDAAAEYKRGTTSGGADMQMGLVESMGIIPPTTDVPDSQIPATATDSTLDNIAAPTTEGTVAKQTNDTSAEGGEPAEPVGGVSRGLLGGTPSVGGLTVRKFAEGVVAAVRGTRDNYTPSSRKVLAGYGDIGFTEVRVCRKPLNDILQGAIKLAAQGKLSYDKLYHLSIQFKLHNGQWLRLDKRETAQAVMGGGVDSGTECRSVSIGAKSPRTVNGVIDATVSRVGKERYFKYRATSWNCQRFVMDVIESAGFGIDADTRGFILQDMGDLFNPSVEAVANLSTDAKSRLSLILEGMGLAVGGASYMRGFEGGTSSGESDPYNQSSEYVIGDGGDSIYLDAKTDRVRRAVAHQYFTDNPYQSRGGCDCDSSNDDDYGLLGGIRDAGLLRLRLSDKLGRFISNEEFADIIQDEEFGGLLVGGNFSDRVDTKLNMQYARAARANTWQNENDRITAILRRETRDRVKENAMKPREQLAYRRRQEHDLYNARRPQQYEPRGQVAGESFY